VPGVGRRTAEAVVSALRLERSTGGIAVNTATGEILDDHPTDDHPTDDHPTDDHPTDDHPTDADLTKEATP
jgi:excinuclease ABC subunit C